MHLFHSQENQSLNGPVLLRSPSAMCVTFPFQRDYRNNWNRARPKTLQNPGIWETLWQGLGSQELGWPHPAGLLDSLCSILTVRALFCNFTRHCAAGSLCCTSKHTFFLALTCWGLCQGPLLDEGILCHPGGGLHAFVGLCPRGYLEAASKFLPDFPPGKTMVGSHHDPMMFA